MLIAGLEIPSWIVLVVIWDAVWKLIAMWKSARGGQKVWFIFLAIINSVGILPLIYILWFQKKGKVGKKVRGRK